MKTVLNILEEIANESSTKKKEAILTLHKDNDDLKEAFRLAYDKRLSFGISKVPEMGEFTVGVFEVRGLTDALSYLSEILVSRKHTGHEARDNLGSLVCSMDISNMEDDAEVIRRIIDRDLKCGIGRTVPNKVWKDLIPKQPQMLCNPMNEKNLSRIKYPAYAQLKADGARCFLDVVWDTVNETVEVTMVSRAGNDYYGLDHIKNDIKDVLTHVNGDFNIFAHSYDEDGIIKFTIDGELISLDKFGNHAERAINNGILNKSLKNTITKEESELIHLFAWDFIPQGAFDIYPEEELLDIDTDRVEYQSRLVNLEHFLNMGISYIHLLPNDVVDNVEQAKELFRQYVSQGYEGIILKNIDARWKDGRSNDQVKFKEEFFIDMEVVGFIENDTYPNTLGSLQLRSKCGTIEANCGSGFTYTFQKKVGKEWIPIPLEDRPDNDRELIWKNRDQFLGKIVEVKCNTWTTSEGRETKSLFLPIFERWRFDKTDANTFDEVW